MPTEQDEVVLPADAPTPEPRRQVLCITRPPAEAVLIAKQLIGEARGLEALLLLEHALRTDPEHAGCLSHYAMLIALERGQIRRGLELVQAALELDPVHPEVHLNTARIYLKAGMKAEALHCLRAGLQAAPNHPELLTQLQALGVRRRPILRMLRRNHPLNRFLGRLFHAFASWRQRR